MKIEAQISSTIGANFSENLPEGVSVLEVERLPVKDLFLEVGEVISFTINFGSGVSASIVASWLVEKFRSRTTRVLIDGKPCSIEHSVLEEVVRQEIDRVNSINPHGQ